MVGIIGDWCQTTPVSAVPLDRLHAKPALSRYRYGNL